MASPLWGKLSPQVTDEGATTGHFPLIRRVPRHLPPKGKALRYGFPLWGKLSPQVTDEGATTGHFPLIRRVPRHLPPKGKAFAFHHKNNPPPFGGGCAFMRQCKNSGRGVPFFSHW